MYFGSRAEARPASKTPNRVSAEAAISAAPASAAAARFRPAEHRAGQAGGGQHLAGLHQRARPPVLVRFGGRAQAAQQQALGDQLSRGPQDGQPDGRPGVVGADG